jgi:hypothetical protein
VAALNGVSVQHASLAKGYDLHSRISELICAWYREVLCAAQPDLFEPDDPVRQKIETMRAKGKAIIWHPLPPKWR